MIEMLKAGMNVARLNFSHGDHESQQILLDNLRFAMMESGIDCKVLLDTKGPEIRTGTLEKPMEIKCGDLLTIHSNPDFIGRDKEFGCSYDLTKSVQEMGFILIADGNLSCQV